MSTLKHESPLTTLSSDMATNIISGLANEDWLLFYLGGKAQPHSPYTNMEKFEVSRIYFCEFDDFELKLGAQPDLKRAYDYNTTPKDQVCLQRWRTNMFYGYKPEDIVRFTWKDVITYGGQKAQLSVRPAVRADLQYWNLEYRSDAKNELPEEHLRLMQVFFSAIDGGTLQIEKLDSPIPAAKFAAQAAQMTNVHGGVPVGYDDRAYWAIKSYATTKGIALGHNPYVSNSYRPPIRRELPAEWRTAAGR